MSETEVKTEAAETKTEASDPSSSKTTTGRAYSEERFKGLLADKQSADSIKT